MYELLLQTLLKLKSNSQIATITTLTKPKVKAGGPNVLKLARTQVLLNTDYSRAMSKKLGMQFEAGPRKWGHRVRGTCLVEHLGEYYLETQPIRVLEETYTQNGMVIPKALVEPYLPPEPLLKWRDYSLKNVQEIVVAGQRVKKCL